MSPNDRTETMTCNAGTPTVMHPDDGTKYSNWPKSDEIGGKARGAQAPSVMVPYESMHFDASNAFWQLSLDTDDQVPYNRHSNHLPYILPAHDA